MTNKWEEFFKIVTIENPAYTADSWIHDMEAREPWSLFQVTDPDGLVVGTYKDFKYAKRQARYKFKKLQAKLEKILLV